ncbi:MAG: ABC transporter ATP-binding protein [Sulfobacillus benefaciens]|uniref:ABC transporter ATP-binding protein n=1 Tax=Sulfobacillus benefaciens TaxID=453960 RepID=A0A2T2XCU0_9FIRM|nr:MAG: ABC transporter ATP-binding protein [Sulfobacillus benefaciens]
MRPTQPVLQVKNLSARYGVMQVLWDVTLEIGSGERVVLLGSNGAGKTTLLKTLCGLVPAMHGTILLQQQPVDALRVDQRIRRGLAFVSELGMIPTLTVEENLVLGGYYLSNAIRHTRIAEMYQKFPDLWRQRRWAAGSLSGGQRKMLAVAKALIARPTLIIMDEPSSGLSPLLVQELIAILRQLDDGSTAFFIAEQNIKFLDLATRAYVLEGGRLRFTGTVAELHADNTLRTAYFGLR